MEQSIDSNKKPEFAAGTDPAFIPGLTGPVATRKAEPKPEAGSEVDTEADTEADARTEGDATTDAELDAASEPLEAEAPEVEADAGAAAEEGQGERDAEDGPVFEVSDRRGSIRVAGEGVRFRLDDQEADFRWEEIGAVEITPARFGRRFTVTVHLSTRRWFNAEVEAESRSELKAWPAELEAVLDVYFEES